MSIFGYLAIFYDHLRRLMSIFEGAHRNPLEMPKVLRVSKAASAPKVAKPPGSLNIRYWHFSDIPPALTNVRYRG
jgi:hypothetical protein